MVMVDWAGWVVAKEVVVLMADPMEELEDLDLAVAASEVVAVAAVGRGRCRNRPECTQGHAELKSIH